MTFMTSEHTDSGDAGHASRTRRGRSRRAFLTGSGVSLAALAGCTFDIDVGVGGSDSEAPTATKAATRTPTATRTATETRTPTATPTPEPDPEFEVITVQPEPIEVELVTPTPELRYRVERLYLYINAASDAVFDGPNTEEIYGEITITASDGTNEVETTRGQDLLWAAQRADHREIADGEGAVLDTRFSPVEFVFPDPGSIDNDAYIEVVADLYERDKGANEDDEFVQFQMSTGSERVEPRWYLDMETVATGYRRPDGQSKFVMEYGGNGTELNLSYNVVER
jgi:hypothetical protein